MWFGWTLIVIV